MSLDISTIKEEFLPQILMYASPQMYVSAPRYGMTFYSADSHEHPGYEFMLPLTDMPLIRIDEKIIHGYRNHIIPINPGQDHGVSGKMDKVKFINLFYTEDFLKEIIYDAFREVPAGFNNDNYPVSPELFTMINMFIKECIKNTPEKSAILGNLSRTIAILIYRTTKKNMTTLQWGKPFNADTLKIEKVVGYIKDNYKNGCSLEELSELAGVSRFHLIRIFREYMGKTPYEYLLEVRLENAKLMLLQEETSITDICFECGFNNMSHFIRMFKKKIGISPSIYRSFSRIEQ